MGPGPAPPPPIVTQTALRPRYTGGMAPDTQNIRCRMPAGVTGTTLKVTYYQAGTIPTKVLGEVVALTVTNMNPILSRCLFPHTLEPRQVRAGLRQRGVHILTATVGRCLVGVCAYALEQEDGKQVVYVHELQVEALYRGKGLGGTMLEAVEEVA